MSGVDPRNPRQRRRAQAPCGPMDYHTGPDVPADEEMLREPRAAPMIGVSVSTLRRWRAQSYGPPWTRCGPKAIRYRAGGIREWLAAREHAENRDTA